MMATRRCRWVIVRVLLLIAAAAATCGCSEIPDRRTPSDAGAGDDASSESGGVSDLRRRVALDSQPPAADAAGFAPSTDLRAAASDIIEGFGGGVTGGAGGQHVVVTSLSDDGSQGTLRDAVSQGNRVVHFAVAGVVQLKAELKIEAANLTIDGTTAPPPGITIKGKSTIIEGPADGPAPNVASNIIIRGLRFRGGYDSLRLWRNAHHVVIDHCSFSGSGDGGCDITEGVRDVTFSWNIVAKVPSGKAMLVKYETSRISIHHNLYVDTNGRNPQVASCRRTYSKGPAQSDPIADIRYNVIWGFDYAMILRGHDAQHALTANVESNLFSAAPGGVHASNHIIPVGDTGIFVAGNATVQDCRTTSQWMSSVVVTDANSMSNHPQWSTPSVSGPANDDAPGRLATWGAVVASAGPSMFDDDAVDAAARAAVSLPETSLLESAWN